jgi:hypothetical protein
LLHLLCLGGIISLPWFSKGLKMTYQRTTVLVASSLYFSFANQYSLGGGLRFQYYWCLGTSYLCVTLLSNLISLAFRELVSLRVGCVTMWSWGSHHLVSELGSINQVISFWIFSFLVVSAKTSLVSNFFFSLILQHIKKIVISFGFCPKYIN